MQMQMHISFTQKGMTVAVGERKVLIGERARITASVAVALLVHVFMLWSLMSSRFQPMDINVVYDNTIDTELYRPEPVEPIPPHTVPKLRQVPLASTPEPRPQVEPAPSPQPPNPQPVQAQVEPTPQPTPQVKVAPRPVETVQAINTPVAKALPQSQPNLQDSPANVPTVSDEPAPMKVKKKDEDQALDAKRQIATTSTAPTELNLHEAAIPSVQSAPVAPSGLPANPSSRLAAGGGMPSGGAASAAAGGQGAAGLKGRGNATQALQNHENCITRQTEGKPIPAECKMQDYASMKSTGPRPVADLQAAAAKRDARLKYKTDPGNHEYWKRVGHAPSAYHQSDDHPTPGQYSNAKDQRVMTGNVNSRR